MKITKVVISKQLNGQYGVVIVKGENDGSNNPLPEQVIDIANNLSLTEALTKQDLYEYTIGLVEKSFEELENDYPYLTF